MNKCLTRGNKIFIAPLFILVLILFFKFSGILGSSWNAACCDFHNSEINGIVKEVDFLRGENSFVLQGNAQKRYYFIYEQELSNSPRLFHKDVKPDNKIIKEKESDTLYVTSKNGINLKFVIINCCTDN